MGSACVPFSRRTPPPPRTYIESAFTMLLSPCVTAMVVRLDIAALSAVCTVASNAESSLDIASSDGSMRGFRMRARAIAIRCRCPSERRCPLVPISMSKPLLVHITFVSLSSLSGQSWKRQELDEPPSAENPVIEHFSTTAFAPFFALLSRIFVPSFEIKLNFLD